MDLSIIITVFNSENILEKLINRIYESSNAKDFPKKFEVILINDFSHDGSWKKIKSLSSEFGNIKGINLNKNYGQHNAIMAGLNECVGDIIITMDDDLQHPPESIKDIYNELNKNFDVCYVYYLKRKHILWKKVVSRLNNLIASYLLNKPIKIYMSSFRGFKKEIVQKIIQHQESRVYLDALILKTTKNISMISVPHHKRLYGDGNYSFKKLISLWSDMVINFFIYPIRFATFYGLIIKYLIIIYRKIFLKNKQNRNQYLIKEKTISMPSAINQPPRTQRRDK